MNEKLKAWISSIYKDTQICKRCDKGFMTFIENKSFDGKTILKQSFCSNAIPEMPCVFPQTDVIELKK